jgi:lipopolysaccharide biosynthesis glycosyltransferase
MTTVNAARQGTRNAVCLCTDRRMLIPALFVADAVLRHSAASENRFDVIIFAEPPEVTDVHRRWMEQHHILLCEDMDLSPLRGVGKFAERLSPATLMKLMMPHHLADRYEKILYLDADLTIHDNVAAIFSLDTAPYALAAAPSGRILVEYTEKQRKEIEDHFIALGMTKPFRFFNTGVLYIDVAGWNREELGDRALSYIRENPDLCTLPDEHALNAVLDGGIAELSPGWNMRAASWRRITEGIARPIIIHHTGEDKPWRRFSYHRRLFADLTAYRSYKDFLRDSPWPGWLDEQWNWHNLHGNILWEMRRARLKLTGKLEEPSAEQCRAYIEAFRRHCEEGKFVDVDQGVVLREKGKLRLKATVAAR